MNDKKWKEFIQREMDKEMEEIESVLEKINNDPEMREWTAPEEIHDRLFEQIRAKEAEKAHLSDEEKELIRLGMIYKKRRKYNKLLVLAAAVVCALAVGVTSIGGPKKVIEKVQGMLDGREQIHNDSEDDRTKDVKTINEVEAYQKIEDEYGFRPVELVYLPEGIQFEDIDFTDKAQNVYMGYLGENQETIVYSIYPNYRTGSIGHDVEDEWISEYEKVVCDVTISVKEYFIEENQSSRYKISYEYQNVFYFLEMNYIEKQEVEKIIENLFFN